MPSRFESFIGDNEFNGKPVHLLDMPNKQRLAFLNSFDGVFVSCEGVLWMFWGPIPYAGYAINLFKKMGKTVRFLTNNSMRSDDELIAIFQALGIENVVPADVIAPAKTMMRYVKRVMPGKPVFSLCEPSVNSLLQKGGIKLKTMKPMLRLNLDNLASRMAIDDKVGAVFMDVNINVTMSELMRAQQYLEDPECLLIVGANNNKIPLSEKVSTIGPGGFVNLLKESSGKDPIMLSKSPLLSTELMEQFSIKKPNRFLFIGESLYPDIAFANRCGFQSLLILAGSVKMENIKKMRPPERPDYVLDKLTEFIDFMADLN